LAAQQLSEESDERLLHSFTSSRVDSAFAVLVHRHGPMVLHVCRRVLGHEQDAEDAFQATFLVLARNAASVRNKTSLASFLHGIAYRTAMKAKQSAARRRKYEGRASALPPSDPADDLSWREVRGRLDEEIARLPEKYRVVFVLHLLEDLSREETAQRLGLKDATVAKRLAEARKRLSKRLARRGVELTAVLTVATMGTEPASALPAGLMTTTLKAAIATVAGERLAAVVSASVAELVKSTTVAMMMCKARIATLILLILTLLSGGGVWAYQGLASIKGMPSEPSAEPPTAKVDNQSQMNRPEREIRRTREIRGRVFAPDGKPKAGAKLLLLGLDKKILELGVTAADGGFSVSIPKEATHSYLIAQADETGFDVLWIESSNTKEPVELRLVKDQSIRGRVVNTEGKPVAGVRVTVTDINIYPNNSLDQFLAFWKNLQVPRNPLYGQYQLQDAAGALFVTRTNADGRFVVRGLGEERFVSLRLSGAGIADTELWIATRPGFDPQPFNQAVLDNTSKDMIDLFGPGRRLHAPEVTAVAEAEKIIRGRVKEAESGKGRPNVAVHLNQMLYLHFEARTDAEGRYEIRGARKVKSYALEVRSDPATGYMGCQVRAEDSPGNQPVAADLAVKKGVIVTGKMIDQATGNPVSGMVRIVALKDNPFVKEHPGIESVAWNSVRVTDGDGVFRVVSIPGPVLLMGGPRGTNDDFKYQRSEVDPKYRRYFRNSVSFYGLSGGISPIQGIYFKVLQIEPDTKIVEQNIVLERLSALTVQIQDDDGKPLANACVAGLTTEGHYPTWYTESSCTAYGNKPRLMIFYHLKRKLAAAITLKGDEKQPVVVKLGPAGAFKGRLLDSDGKPLAGIRIDLRYHHLNADAMHRCIHEDKQIVTDANGTFAHDDLIPGCRFELSFRRGRQRFDREIKPADATIQVRPGECRDLGVLKLK
jgi:RNA polymerase sigma factor (sigma-70 family)